ncbi:MAG: hypothetical protein HKN32_00640, partial [Flavobacteriales bacterium]|nr:hypothetical protein [Flavobacteriales bacterium]
MKRAQIVVLSVLAGIMGVSMMSWTEQQPRTGYHSWEELIAMRGGEADNLPQNSNSVFTGSGRCGGCHGHDIDNFANVDLEGNDVNPTDDWRATMMANSAKDPFWQAKVTHEVAVNPDHQEVLEDKCTSCHAPMGHYAAHFDGALSYSFAEMLTDSLALDGVSCGACHQINEENAGEVFSGVLDF